MQRLRTLHLFAGAGGGILADLLLGHQPVCAVEIDQYCQRVLLQRQRDGAFPWFPVYSDIKEFDGNPWRGHIDVVSGGFPCQDISSAGKGAGLDGARSGLWFEMLRVVGEVRPAFVFAENSPRLRTRGLRRVIAGLTGLGYECVWGVLGAGDVGAPHIRKRMWIVAAHPDVCRERGFTFDAEVARAQGAAGYDGDANGERQRRAQHEPPQRAGDTGGADAAHTNGVQLREQSGRSGGQGGEGAPQPREDGAVGRTAADTNGSGLEVWRSERSDTRAPQPGEDGNPGRRGVDWWSVHRFAGVDDGNANRLDRIRATGNAQVCLVAALAWSVLSPLVIPYT